MSFYKILTGQQWVWIYFLAIPADAERKLQTVQKMMSNPCAIVTDLSGGADIKIR